MTITTVQKIIKIGSSQGVTIPAKELRALGVQAGDELEIIARPKTKHTSDTTVVKTANVLLDRYDQDFKNLAQR